MKRIVASIGVAALGATCVQSANAQGSDAKPWSASVALRGFYDDNVNGTKIGKIETWGGEISPTLGFAMKTDQTTVSLVYKYDYLYYDKSPNADGSHDDQTHTIGASLLHAFNERTTIAVSDSFVLGQEPDVLRAGPDYTSFQRISGNNIVNYGNLTLNHQFAPKFGMEVGYANSLFNYEDDFYQIRTPLGIPVVEPSYSGLLNRIEQVAHLDARWTIQPTTIGLIGYAFSWDHYTGDQPISAIYLPTPQLVYSDARDSRAHYAYVGAEHSFRSDLHGSLRAGARFTDYFNSPENQSSTTPYVRASLNYDYSKDGSFQVGVSHDMSATDVISTSVQDGITTDAATTSVYASLTHHILPKLTGSLMGQFQNSTYNGGRDDGKNDLYYVLNAGLSYQIDRHIATSVSYNYDLLDSDIPGRGFGRNRVFLGVTLTY